MEELVVHLGVGGDGRLENSHPNLCTRSKGSHCLGGYVPASKGAGGGAVPSSPAPLAPQQDMPLPLLLKCLKSCPVAGLP